MDRLMGRRCSADARPFASHRCICRLQPSSETHKNPRPPRREDGQSIMPWGFFRSKDEDGNSRSDHQTSWLPMTKDDDGGRRTGWFSARNGNGTGHGDSWTDAAQNYLDVPGNWIAPVAAAALTLGVYSFYQSYLRRFPTPHHIAPGVFRKRSLFGKVTSVGDGDGFHLYHTPGGRLAGWGWLRRVPTDRKQLKGQTVSRDTTPQPNQRIHPTNPAPPYLRSPSASLV